MGVSEPTAAQEQHRVGYTPDGWGGPQDHRGAVRVFLAGRQPVFEGR
ncbi:hypothetical protein AB0O75_39700 [Streptomyces sp. NPDC088921]